MFAKLQDIRDNREQGFTLIELLVVILIIGILAAVAIPMFMNQRKGGVDATVQSDVKNAATQVETWASKQGATVEALPTGTAASSTAALSDIKVSDGTTLKVYGNSYSFCIVGQNTGGDLSNGTARVGIAYRSTSGGLQNGSSSCTASANGGADGGWVVPSTTGSFSLTGTTFGTAS